jgi:UPF0755 protein
VPSDDFWADLPSERQKKSASTPSTLLPNPVPKAAIDVPEAVPAENPSRRTKSWLWLGFAIKLLVAIGLGTGLGLGLLLIQGITMVADQGEITPKLVTIERGTSTKKIAESLETNGLIISRWPLLMYTRLSNRTLQAGVYSLSASMTPSEIVNLLAAGTTTEQTLTIPEGWRVEQIADLLAQTGVVEKDDFLTASRYDPVRYTLPSGISREVGASLEGLLFPDTYRFSYGVSSKEIVATMLDNFRVKTNELTPTDNDLILASIIEREAKTEAERPIIAGVYTNRLKQNIRLQADPTVQYGKDTLAAAASDAETFAWWEPITVEDYQAVKSPFNTYLISGLPEAPIANPGLLSLAAAKQPAPHDYFYFFHRADGTTVFSKTLEEHNRARQSS